MLTLYENTIQQQLPQSM